ncbi:MAG: c-type cytochrome [Phycisphaerae bacterium]
MGIKEWVAIAGVVAVLAGTPAAMLSYERGLTATGRAEARVITLTGVGTQGLWTVEDVVGHSYWRREYERATLMLEARRPVILRLKSADATHKFYSPAIGVGPVEVEPGHVAVVEFVAPAPGTYEYYCVAVCGECHPFMRGEIVVYQQGGSPPDVVHPPTTCIHRDLLAPDTDDLVARGAYLFRRYGCFTCHGERAEGGVANYNYAKGSVPTLNTMADKLFLYDPQEADAFIKLLKLDPGLKGVEGWRELVPAIFSRFDLTLARYQSVKMVIANGNPVGKADVHGPEPPLWMQGRQYRFSDRDIDALVAYFVSQFPRG